MVLDSLYKKNDNNKSSTLYASQQIRQLSRLLFHVALYSRKNISIFMHVTYSLLLMQVTSYITMGTLYIQSRLNFMYIETHSFYSIDIGYSLIKVIIKTSFSAFNCYCKDKYVA